VCGGSGLDCAWCSVVCVCVVRGIGQSHQVFCGLPLHDFEIKSRGCRRGHVNLGYWVRGVPYFILRVEYLQARRFRTIFHCGSRSDCYFPRFMGANLYFGRFASFTSFNFTRINPLVLRRGNFQGVQFVCLRGKRAGVYGLGDCGDSEGGVKYLRHDSLRGAYRRSSGGGFLWYKAELSKAISCRYLCRVRKCQGATVVIASNLFEAAEGCDKG
jgi:hypothetical protein